ncbi:MAG: hypothetical protein IKM88_07725 [Lachnospiraceae bacterium]|nr:hypothetical protein [Lachnospiraceae bacterium]MBR3734686.1 hypothetical protein [Lachnospiraceae bacterium]MBR6850103.1 hypothetical protein [Lachnospiraceae bacterium]
MALNQTNKGSGKAASTGIDDYPDNLLLTIGVVPETDYRRYHDQVEGLSYAMRCLSPIEKDILHRYFEQRQSPYQIGLDLGLKKSQVSRMRRAAVEKLTHPTRLRMIAMGIANAITYDSNLKKLECLKEEVRQLQVYRDQLEAVKDGKHITVETPKSLFPESEPVSIDQCGFPIRIRNCLHRNGLHTVQDLEKAGTVYLQNIRGIGDSGLKKIQKLMEDYCKNIAEVEKK